MANYGELKALVAAFSKRDDLNQIVVPSVYSPIDYFFQLAHNDILTAQDWQVLEKGQVLLAADATPLAGAPSIWELAAPARSTMFRSVTTSRGRDLAFYPPSVLVERFGSHSGGSALAYSIVGKNFWLAPGASDVLVIYQEAALPLVTDTDTNEISLIFPNLYVYGALVHLHRYVQDTEEMQKAQNIFDAELAAANRIAVRQRFGDAPAMIGV